MPLSHILRVLDRFLGLDGQLLESKCHGGLPKKTDRGAARCERSGHSEIERDLTNSGSWKNSSH
jgi:hypothetical protein